MRWLFEVLGHLAGDVLDVDDMFFGEVNNLTDSEPLREMMKAQRNLAAQADVEMFQELIEKLSRSGGTPTVCYEESDQSPLTGDASSLLKAKCTTAMDYAPHTQHSTAWATVLFAGDYDGVLKILEGKTKDEVKQLLRMRESMMNICAVFHVIQGARIFNSPSLDGFAKFCRRTLTVKNEHIKILYKLLSLGVDVNVRDVAGFTPLHLCVQIHSNSVTLKMAEILIKAGAEVDAKNRFGATPLLGSTYIASHDCISLLLKYGADPSNKNNNDWCARQVAMLDPKIRSMFGEAEKKQAKEERRELRKKQGGKLSKCSVCEKDSDTRKCSGCFSVLYCGRECQMEAWPRHQQDCKERRAQYSVGHLKLREPGGNYTNYITGKVYEINDSGPKKSNFVVKIELEMNVWRKPIKGRTMLVSNKDHSLDGFLEKKDNKLLHSKLENVIIEKGVAAAGLKGYFHAVLSPEAAGKARTDSNRKVRIEINAENILPREPW